MNYIKNIIKYNMDTNTITVQIKSTNNDNFNSTANSTANSTPQQAHVGDCGLDLEILYEVIVPAGARGFMVNLQFKCAAYTSDGLGLCYFLLPRSSTGLRTPLRLANNVGVIDSSYRGEIKALVDNMSNEDYTIVSGSRLFQLVFLPIYTKFNIVEVDELDNTARGEGGFGSTGK